jgi:hypothetical protein
MVVNKAAPPPKPEGSKNPPRPMARLFQEFRLSILGHFNIENHLSTSLQA